MELPKNTPKIIELCIEEYFDDFEGDITQEDFNQLNLEDMYWTKSTETNNNPQYIRIDVVKELLKLSSTFGWERTMEKLNELYNEGN